MSIEAIKVQLDRAKEIVKTRYLLSNRQSILWLGAPGIGKSAGVRQIAQELANEVQKSFVHFEFRWKGENFYSHVQVYEKAAKVLKQPEKYFTLIEMRPLRIEPADITGIPKDFVIEEMALFDYKPFTWQLVASACAGIFFIDEFTNTQRLDVKGQLDELIWDRRAGWIAFNDDLLVMAAGNTPEDSAIASMPSSTSINRVFVMKIEPPSIEGWAEWMNANVKDWDRRVYAFLRQFPQFFFQRPPDIETLEPFPTPRQWTELAKISHYFPDEEIEVLAYGNIGGEAAAHFATFVKTRVPDLSEILVKPDLFAPLSVDGRYLVISQLSAVINKELNERKPNLGKFVRFLNWLLLYDREMLQLMLTMLGRDGVRRLHSFAIPIPTLRDIAKFIKETVVLTREAGV